ncbi:MAG TPA: hypothetical protein VNF04_05030, partial [Stellaceae bacterium]|nr:hypothetical protein [Stellaceae bacterium]
MDEPRSGLRRGTLDRWSRRAETRGDSLADRRGGAAEEGDDSLGLPVAGAEAGDKAVLGSVRPHTPTFEASGELAPLPALLKGCLVPRHPLQKIPRCSAPRVIRLAHQVGRVEL